MLMKPQALVEQKKTFGMPISPVAARVKLVKESEITQLTRGAPELGSFRAVKSCLNGVGQCSLVETQREGMSWFMSVLEGGRPSGMVAKRKSEVPSRAEGPPFLRMRWWLNSVLTKVMKKPLKWRTLARCNMAFMWPWAGNGTQTAWGLVSAMVDRSATRSRRGVIYATIKGEINNRDNHGNVLSNWKMCFVEGKFKGNHWF